MKNTRIPASSFLPILIIAILGVPACGKNGSSSVSGTVTSVAISPAGTTAAPIDVPINETTNFTATVNLSGGTASTSTTVTWEVNGVAGGSSTTGTIVPSTTDAQVGVYTAPGVVPATNNGQVDITAVAPLNPGSTSTNTVTSNTSVVQIGAGNGLVITPSATTVPAGGTRQFSAKLNGVSDTNVTWSKIAADSADNFGNIDPQSGLYTAPNFPPPGGVVTISATDNLTGANITATAQIIYSDLTFNGPFAFSYAGNDSGGFLAEAGSIVTDGDGHIVSGIEDSVSTLTGASSQVAISGTYTVGPDGRGSATINTGRAVETWQFVLTTNQHALLTRFDRTFTGSGTIDQQTLPLTANDSQLDGPFVFGVSGLSTSFVPESVAGRFDVHGDGTIPTAGSIFDLNNNGAVTASAALQACTYDFDDANVGTGRGTITLNGIDAKAHKFAFYVIDSSSSQGHLHLVEIDGNGSFAGDMYAGVAGGGQLGVSSLAAANYAFTSGGTATVGMPAGPVAYGAGGVFTSDGNGNVSGGEMDSNIGGTADGGATPLKPATINACPYTVDSTTGRVFLNLLTAAGACPAAPGAATPQFALYQTALGSGVLIELDSIAVSVGLELQQAQSIPTTPPVGNFAFALAGQGAFHNAPALIQPDVDGQFAVGAAVVIGQNPGNVDINNFNAVFKGDPVTATGFAAGTPDASGRDTLTFSATNPAETFDVAVYIVNASTALVLDTDTSPVAIGSVIQQF